MLNWEVIARGELHAMRVAILELMMTDPPAGDPGWSARTLATALGKPLATTSHHTRLLRDRGWLIEVGDRRVRGALQTFYRLSDAALDR